MWSQKRLFSYDVIIYFFFKVSSIVMRQRLHWLDVSCRIRFKLCVLAYRCSHGTAPVYLSGTLYLFHLLLDGLISGLRRLDYSAFQLRRLSLGHDHSQFRAHWLGTHFHPTYDAPTWVSWLSETNSKPIFFQIQSEPSIITLSCFYNL